MNKTLQTMLAELNEITGNNFELDNAPVYGGYTLTANNGSQHIVGRMKPPMMRQYLAGALDFVTRK